MPSRHPYEFLREPGMFTPKEAEEVIPSAVEAAWSEISKVKALSEDDARSVLTKRLDTIASKYVSERRYFNLSEPQAYRGKFNQIRNDAERLLKHLDELRGVAGTHLFSSMRRGKNHDFTDNMSGDPI